MYRAHFTWKVDKKSLCVPIWLYLLLLCPNIPLWSRFSIVYLYFPRFSLTELYLPTFGYIYPLVVQIWPYTCMSYVTFGVYAVPFHLIRSARLSRSLSNMTPRALSWQLMNIEREMPVATSGPRVLLERSWWQILDMNGGRNIVPTKAHVI